MRKQIKVEISKITLGIIITSIFSLFTISISTFYNANEKIFNQRITLLNNLTNDKSNLITLLENIDDILSISKEQNHRLKEFDVLKQNLNQKFFFGEKNTNKWLSLSSKKRKEIKKSIKILDFQKKINLKGYSDTDLKKALIELLKKEAILWSSFDNLFLSDKSTHNNRVKLLKKIELDNLEFTEWVNRFNSNLEKDDVVLNEIISNINKQQKDYNDLKKEINLIKKLSLFGIIFCLLLIIPIITISIKHIKNVS